MNRRNFLKMTASTDCKDILKTLSKALIDYGQQYNDPRVLLPANMKRLKQAVSLQTPPQKIS